MRRRMATVWLGSGLLLGCIAPPAAAQGEQPPGVRAAGMGGAFTAVADDASATVWNPAGLASGAYFSGIVDFNSLKGGGSGTFAGVAMPALGFSYQRIATGSTVNGRNTLVAQSAGVSLVQSLGQSGIAVGTTLKLVHGETTGGSVSGPITMTGNAFDADVGVMVSGSLGEAGLTVHNLTRPAFDAAGGEIHLDRTVRGGVAVRVWQGTTVAADADFTRSAIATGNGDSPLFFWRDAAVGVERAPVPSVRLRGGVHWNTAGGAVGAAPTASVGGSYAIRGSLMADGQVSWGSKDGTRGWGAGLRVSF